MYNPEPFKDWIDQLEVLSAALFNNIVDHIPQFYVMHYTQMQPINVTLERMQ